jgi:hypothetical protein
MTVPMTPGEQWRRCSGRAGEQTVRVGAAAGAAGERALPAQQVSAARETVQLIKHSNLIVGVIR